MVELSYLQQNALIEMNKRINIKSKVSDIALDLIKDTKRVQILLNSKISSDELKKISGCGEGDILSLRQNNYIKKIGSDYYVLNLKGILKSVSLISNQEQTMEQLLETFISQFFEDSFKNLSMLDQNLTSYEKTWLLSMIFLGSFDSDSSINVREGENGKRYGQLFNRLGQFLYEQGYISEFKPIVVEGEYLRRELYSIEKKISNIDIGKQRETFYIGIKSKTNTREILSELLKRIFYDSHLRLSVKQLDLIREQKLLCKQTALTLSRKLLRDDNKLDEIIDDAIRKL